MYSNVAQGLLFHVWLKSCSEVALLLLDTRGLERHTPPPRSSWEQRVNAKSKPETRGSITFRSSPPCLSENTNQQSLHTKASLDRFFGCFGKCLKYSKWDTIRNAHWSPSTYNSYAFMTDEKELFAIQLRKVAFGYFSVFFKFKGSYISCLYLIIWPHDSSNLQKIGKTTSLAKRENSLSQ